MSEVSLANFGISINHKPHSSPSNRQTELHRRVEEIEVDIAELESRASENLTLTEINDVRSKLEDLEQSTQPAFGFGQDIQQLKLDTTQFDNLNARLNALEAKTRSSRPSS
ncbi:MAG: hypothetical protein P8104_11060 [Gammaproteobacteria bacterium]